MEIEQKIENIKQNAKQYLKTWSLSLIVIVTSAIYVLYSMIKLEPNQDVEPIVITAAVLIGIVCALITKSAYGEIGFSLGYNSEFYKNELDKYNDACSLCLDYQDRVSDFYIKEEQERKRLYRKTVLASNCMRYTDWFDDEGIYIGSEEKRSKLDKHQEKALKKCIAIKIFVPDLFKEKTRSVENYAKKDKTDSEQRATVLAKNSIAAIIPNVVQVLFIPTITKWNWATVISGLITIAIWTITGLLQLYGNYNFVVQSKVTQLRDKKELMSKFIKGCEKGIYKSDLGAENEKNNTDTNNNNTIKLL